MIGLDPAAGFSSGGTELPGKSRKQFHETPYAGSRAFAPGF
jgi:hypothetical protein